MGVSIVGWGHTKFGKFDGLDLESLIAEATREALASAAIDAADIDSIRLGNLNGGFVPEVFCSSLVMQADLYQCVDVIAFKAAS